MEKADNRFMGDMLQQECNCGEMTYIFENGDKQSTWTKCRQCGKKIYQLNCEGCSGYSVAEGDHEFFQNDGIWVCPICHRMHQVREMEVKETANFHKNEIPEEVLLELKKKEMPLWVKVLFIVIFVSLFILSVVFRHK